MADQGLLGVPPPRPFLTPLTPPTSTKGKQPEEPTRLPGGACIPPEIEPLKHKILLAGKYLNVIRACGGQIKSDFETYTSEDIDLGSDRCAHFLVSTIQL